MSRVFKKNLAPSASPLPSGFPTPIPATAGGSAGVGAGAEEAFYETHVAARLGVAREKIAALRAQHLAAGMDFVVRGNAVILTTAGMARLQALMAADWPQIQAGDPAVATSGQPAGDRLNLAGIPAAAVPLPACQPERARVVVVRTLPNPHLILVRRAEGSAGAQPSPVLVRVKNNAHFHPRLAPFECQRGADGMWRYLGRLPRSLGRW